MCCVFWYSFFSPFQTYIRHPGYKGKKGGRGIHMCCVFWYSFFSPFQTHQTSGLKMEIGKQGGVGGVIYLHINIKFPTFFSSFQFWGLASQNGRTRQGFSHFGFSRVALLAKGICERGEHGDSAWGERDRNATLCFFNLNLY